MVDLLNNTSHRFEDMFYRYEKKVKGFRRLTLPEYASKLSFERVSLLWIPTLQKEQSFLTGPQIVYNTMRNLFKFIQNFLSKAIIKLPG